MRQADSTIKGYLYQFNKSILEILQMSDDDSVVLEGIIEDIDIISTSSMTTIQCKYHEDKKYILSSVAVPILEMFSNYCEASYMGKKIQYILYAYFADNVDYIEDTEINAFLETTQDKEILLKFFHKIYNIPDMHIINIANKPKKTQSDKDTLISYYKTNRNLLTPRASISSFWTCFQYKKAEQYDCLMNSVLGELQKISDFETASTLYYPNALSYVATISSKKETKSRTVYKKDLLEFLFEQKKVLLNKWALEAIDRKKLLKSKRDSLCELFASNPDIRAFVFTDAFLSNNSDTIIPFIREYIGKYFKKNKLQRPPIFVFGDYSMTIMQTVILSLYNYQQTVNTGYVGSGFVEDSFINDNNCPKDYVCKITNSQNISVVLLEKCRINQLYIVGSFDKNLESINYHTELLPVSSINELKYLVGLSKSLEE